MCWYWNWDFFLFKGTRINKHRLIQLQSVSKGNLVFFFINPIHQFFFFIMWKCCLFPRNFSKSKILQLASSRDFLSFLSIHFLQSYLFIKKLDWLWNVCTLLKVGKMDELDLTVKMELSSYVLSVLDALKHLKLKNKQTDCFILHCNGFRAGPLVIMSTQFTSKWKLWLPLDKLAIWPDKR